MQPETLPALVSQTALIMEGFEHRCQHVEQQLHAVTQQLNALAQQLPGVVKQSADGSLRSLPPQIVDSVRQGLHNPMQDYQQRLDAAGQSIGDSTQALTQQVHDLRGLHQRLLWKVTGVVTASLALVLTAAIWLSMHYANVICQNQLSAELLQAYNAADVTLCEGQLCARVDTKGKRYGAKADYLPVRPR